MVVRRLFDIDTPRENNVRPVALSVNFVDSFMYIYIYIYIYLYIERKRERDRERNSLRSIWA